MTEIREYAAARGILPTTVVQSAECGSGSTWAKWEAGSSCTLKTADKIRKYMADNPPADADLRGAS